ncbi:MAG TPA: bifunctional UDP-sugar hydrolase/5'-nucleotidase [Xanthobacteraceae bacterium]|nr:bifunctional UDP-sugar hydrolase/5'-nucleotidase [Xanthobacteraceae bacterium]
MTIIPRLLAICLVVAAATVAQAARAKTVDITFILVNDIYQKDDQLMADGRRRGGFARLATIIKSERARGHHVVFAHAGDTLSPSLLSGLDQGAHIMTLINMMPPDIFVPGNHEFDFGKAVFQKRMAEAKFPLYGANLRGPDGKPLPGFKDRAIVTIGGVRVGFTGAITDETPEESSPEDLKFLPPVETTGQQAELLRREGADFVVAVVHIGRKQDYALFDTRTVDLILTGHDHDLFVNYDERNAMVESSSDAHYVTAIDVTIKIDESQGKRQIAWWPRFRIIDTATVRPDPKVAQAVRGFDRTLNKELDAKLATTDVALDSRSATVRTGEAAIGDLFADAIRASTGADAAIINGGGIRADKSYAPGDAIKRRDIFAELPFGNHVALIELSGKDLKAAIENGLSLLPQAAGRFPQVSGLTVEADAHKPAGQRVVSIKVGGEALQETKTYKVATNDFMARGGDGYAMFANGKALIPGYDGPLLVNQVMDYMGKLGTVRSKVEGRIVLQ